MLREGILKHNSEAVFRDALINLLIRQGKFEEAQREHELPAANQLAN